MPANTIDPLSVMQVDGMTHEPGAAAGRLENAEPSDAQLVARTCAGDTLAFDALVRRHYRAAFAVALAHMGNRADAEDVCHDAFVRAADRLEDCRSPDRFIQWLCAIVRNHARNTLERNKVRRAASLEHDTAASPDDSARAAELSELRTRLEEALAVLTPAQREVVLLHDLDGWTHESIAESLGTSAGMSRQHLFHARKRLRALLGPGTKESLR
jgi:RNA polymerase sigma-70 factor, ECF subfamily